LTVTNAIVGSITGNAATATTAGSATTAGTATNLAGGAAGSLPYQTASGATGFLAAGINGQILALASGVPSWIDNQVGTVTSVSGTGTVSGISLSGTVTSTGSLTLGGTLDLSSPPAIGGSTPNSITASTLTVNDNTTFGTSNTDTVNFVARINSDFDPATDNAYDLGRTGHEWRDLYIDGTANIDSLVADTADINAGTIDNTVIGGTTPVAGTFTDLRFNGTLSAAGSTGTSGYVITSNGASAPTWQALPASGLTITDDTTTNATRYLTFTSATSGQITGANVGSTKLQFNPSTGVLSSTSFTGALNGTVGATTASTGSFTTLTASGVTTVQAGTVSAPAITTAGDTNTGIFFSAADTIDFTEGGTAVGQFDSSANFKFNSGYGSVATAYGCRAWVNFNGTTALPSIRGSGNVSSVSDNGGAGNYNVNIDNDMPDANYSAVASHSIDFVIRVDNLAVGSFRIVCNAATTDAGTVSAAVFR
jgi:hypothetical protein